MLKFGGSSVAAVDGWRVIARAARETLAQGRRPLVVCSALAGVSDELAALLDAAAAGDYQRDPEAVRERVGAIRARHARLLEEAGVVIDDDARLAEIFAPLERDLFGAAMLAEASPRLRARVMAAGELASTAAGARLLEPLLGNGAVRWLDARELLRTTATDTSEARRFLTATVPPGTDAELQERLASEGDGSVWLTQGFIAATPDGETALLGRGGSDVSAALFAERLQAERLEIWSDVPGFFTADPRLVPSARLIRHMGYPEAQELASTGAKVLHPRCIEVARRAGLEVRLRCTLRPEAEGTLISARAPDPGEGVLALAVKRQVTLISMETAGMWQQAGFLADVFAVFKRHGLSIDLVSTSETSVSVTLDPLANALDAQILAAVLRELAAYCEPRMLTDLGAISLVGRRLRTVLNELVPALEALHGQPVYLLSQAASDLNLSVVVEPEQVERIVRELHAGFFGAVLEDAIFGPTFERVMGGRAEPVHTRAWWQDHRQTLIELAARGTPVYVYHLGTLRQAVRQLRSARAIDRVLYAVKANDHPSILRAVAEEGTGFDCVSLGEVEHVLEHVPGIDPGQILFTPNFAPRREYERALELGSIVTVDNAGILEQWAESFRGRDIFIRVDPGLGRGHHRGVRTAGQASKFGIAADLLPLARAAAEAAGARVVGLHAHLGSGITDPLAWSETAAALVGLRELFPDVRVLDLGGGLAAPGATGKGFDVEAAAEHLLAFKQLHPELELWLEPGRFLVAEAGVLLARVTQTKTKGEMRFVGLDAGMHTLIRPALYGAYHEIVNLTRLDESATETVEVVGPICESGDVLGHARRLPATHEGDVLLIATAGAYGRVMASTYNRRALPAEALADGA